MQRKKPDHRPYQRALRAIRKQKGLTQVDLAERLQQPQAFVSRFESGERRLDLSEFIWVATALRENPLELMKKVIRQVAQSKKPFLRSR